MAKGSESLTSIEKGALALKNAGQVLIVYGIFWGIVVGGIVFGMDGTLDGVGQMIFGFNCLLISMFLIAGSLLCMRKRAGVVAWWIASPFVLLQFPIGTAAGVYVIVSISKQEAKDVLRPPAS